MLLKIFFKSSTVAFRAILSTSLNSNIVKANLVYPIPSIKVLTKSIILVVILSDNEARCLKLGLSFIIPITSSLKGTFSVNR